LYFVLDGSKYPTHAFELIAECWNNADPDRFFSPATEFTLCDDNGCLSWVSGKFKIKAKGCKGSTPSISETQRIVKKYAKHIGKKPSKIGNISFIYDRKAA
jgi:hypothetical protein